MSKINVFRFITVISGILIFVTYGVASHAQLHVGVTPCKGLSFEEGVTKAENVVSERNSHFVAGMARNDLGEPVAGLDITFFQRTNKGFLKKAVKTKKDGSFYVDGLGDQTVQVEISMDKGRPTEPVMKVEAGSSNIEISIGRFGRIKGRVVTPVGKPTSDVVVTSSTGLIWQEDRTAHCMKDEFVLERVLPGSVVLTAVKEGFALTKHDELILRPGETLEGVVVV